MNNVKCDPGTGSERRATLEEKLDIIASTVREIDSIADEIEIALFGQKPEECQELQETSCIDTKIDFISKRIRGTISTLSNIKQKL